MNFVSDYEGAREKIFCRLYQHVPVAALPQRSVHAGHRSSAESVALWQGRRGVYFGPKRRSIVVIGKISVRLREVVSTN